MQSGAALEGIVGGRLVVGHLLAAKDEALLDGRNPLLLLDLLLDLRDLVVEVDVELDLLAGQGADSGRKKGEWKLVEEEDCGGRFNWETGLGDWTGRLGCLT